MRLALLLLAVLIAACDSSTEPALPLAGTYELESVGGAALPVDASFVDGLGIRRERALLSAELVLEASGIFTESREYLQDGRVDEVLHWGEWLPTGELASLSGSLGVDRVQMIRTRDGLECEHSDGLYRYRATQ